MADDDEANGEDDEEPDEDAEGDGDESKSGGKKKLLIIVGLALFIVIGGAAAAYFTGLLQPLINMVVGGNEEGVPAEEKPAVFYELPEMLVNINTEGRKSTFLKIKVALELEDEADIPKIEAVMPRVIDGFQVYLRELRIEDLKGSAGMYRLREELLTRVSAAVAPVKVKDVLFKEMLVQ